MIQSLYIKNFILIDSLHLDFERGFSAFTGETGAGKSIAMDAIGLLCGDRVNSNMIRTGSDKAVIEGVFTITDTMRVKLEDAGFEGREEVMKKYKEDSRQGVQKLLQKYEREREKYNEELERTERMKEFEYKQEG